MTLQLTVFPGVWPSSLKSIQACECRTIGTTLVLDTLGSQPEALSLCFYVRKRPRAWLCLHSVLRLQADSLQNEGIQHDLCALSNLFPVCDTVFLW